MMIELQGGEFLANKTYKIDYLFKKGGQAFIYVVTHQKLHKKVIIKQTETRDGINNAIEEEGRVLCQLEHPALPKIHNLFEERNCIFLVMDFISGQDINSLILKNGKPFQFSLVINWMNQLLDILDYLEVSGVIHLDVKPKNILIGEGNKLYLIDFGFIKKIGSEHLFKGGTETYASPEQLNDLEIDVRSSIYSLSATAYRLLTNEVPFSALEREKSLLSQNNDPLIPINVKNPIIPINLSDLIYIGMDLSPSNRPQSISIMKELLLKVTNSINILNEDSEKTLASPTKKSRIEISFGENIENQIDSNHHFPFSKQNVLESLKSVSENSEASRLLFCLVDVIDATKEKRELMKNRFEKLAGGKIRIEQNEELLIVWKVINYLIIYPNSSAEEKVRDYIINRWKEKTNQIDVQKQFKLERKHLVIIIRISAIITLAVLILLIFSYCLKLL